jgi:HAE1 family hydrophobic/amphiphilic exporter-1
LLIWSFVFLSPKIGFVLFPSTDEWVINIDIEWQTWAKEDSMEKYITQIDNILSKTEEIKVFYTTVTWNKISVYIDLFDVKIREEKWLLSSASLEKKLEKELLFLKSEWLDLTVAALKWWPPTWSAVWVKLSSVSAQNFDTLKLVSEDFEKYLNWVTWSKNVTSTSSDAPWQFVFSFDKQKLSNIWLNQDDILRELYFYTNWIKAWSIKSGTEDNEITLLFKEFEDNLNPEDIDNLVINTRVWKIRIWDFADFTFKKSVNNISREDWKIIISVWSEVAEWYLPTDIQPLLDTFAENYTYPEWITYIKWWESEENKDLIVSTMKSLFIAIFLIFSILVFQFNSFRQPAIVLYSIILALLWVNVWLYITWNPYSMPFGIWFIALTWIVVNDAIILIDKINKSIQAKLDHSVNNKIDYIEQLVLSWKSRLQPIIVTTLTTVFWVLPLALQDEFWAWLWFTIIFWLFVWSFMTLVVVPILYQIFVIWKLKK